MTEATIAAVEPESCTDDDLDAIHAITDSIARETGAEQREPLASMRTRVRASATSARASRYWLARDRAGIPLGSAGLFWTRTDAARRVGSFGLDVLPSARRRGLGTRLLAHVLDAAATQRKALVQTWTLTGGLGEPFLRAFGGRLGSVTLLSELDLISVDSLVEWVGPVPAELRDDLVRVMFAMNTAPTDDLEVDERQPTVEELGEQERLAFSEGWEGRGIAARHVPTGALVGYTALGIAPGAKVARQGDTVVEPAHRNRGLGRWLKARMLVRLLEERPDVHCVRTDNAASNAPMRSINDALGFRAARSNGIWQVPVDTACRIARARLSR